MKKLKIYLDTSVLGGYFDEEFESFTKSLFDKIISGDYNLIISELTESELIEAPENVKNLLSDLKIHFEKVSIVDEAIDLADEYVKENVVGKLNINDCLHIAIATINKIDILASWNFKHIVNINRIRGYNSINIKNGYAVLEIRSPKDLIDYEE